MKGNLRPLHDKVLVQYVSEYMGDLATPGHEETNHAIVLERGSEVNHVKVGDRVLMPEMLEPSRVGERLDIRERDILGVIEN